MQTAGQPAVADQADLFVVERERTDVAGVQIVLAAALHRPVAVYDRARAGDGHAQGHFRHLAAKRGRSREDPNTVAEAVIVVQVGGEPARNRQDGAQFRRRVEDVPVAPA